MAEWRVIPAYPKYEVSDDAQVRRATPGPGARVGRVLKASLNVNGYPTVSLGGHHRMIHRLMMAAFVGPSDQLVRHLDDVKTHNVLSNLAYGDSVDNAMDILYRGGHHYASRTHCARGHEYTAESTGMKISPNGREARVCRVCRAENRRAHGIPELVIPTHCPFGHEYSEENTGRTRVGTRYCKTCNRLRQRARKLHISYPDYMSGCPGGYHTLGCQAAPR